MDWKEIETRNGKEGDTLQRESEEETKIALEATDRRSLQSSLPLPSFFVLFCPLSISRSLSFSPWNKTREFGQLAPLIHSALAEPSRGCCGAHGAHYAYPSLNFKICGTEEPDCPRCVARTEKARPHPTCKVHAPILVMTRVCSERTLRFVIFNFFFCWFLVKLKFSLLRKINLFYSFFCIKKSIMPNNVLMVRKENKKNFHLIVEFSHPIKTRLGLFFFISFLDFLSLDLQNSWSCPLKLLIKLNFLQGVANFWIF